MESAGVKKMVKWIKLEIKKAKADLECAKKYRSMFGMYEDCGESYHQEVVIAESVLNELIRIKIKTEKFAKRLKYEEIEKCIV